MPRNLIAASVATAWLLVTAQAQAGPILFIHDFQGAPVFNLATVDVATGDVSIIGDMGVQMTDIAFDPDGKLFGLSFTDLYAINKNNAAVTLIGPHGIAGGNALVFGSDGTLYAAGADTTFLFTVDPASGTGTEFFDMGVGSAGDLAFNGESFFLAARIGDQDNPALDELYEIDLAGQVAALVGSFGVDSVFGLATANDTLLYAVAGTEVFTVDTGSGALTFVSDYAGQGITATGGTSFFTEAGAIPEPAALLLVASGLFAVVIPMARRRATA